MATAAVIAVSVADRLWPRLDWQPNGCWNWTGATNSGGYGVIKISGRSCQAHRIAYELINGSIPKDMEIDHLCRNSLCCHPYHLEPVTHKENIIRGKSGALRTPITHCIHGHEYTKENTLYLKSGQRRCRQCNNIWRKNQYWKNKRRDCGNNTSDNNT